ncbi:hypothetical protein [Rhizobium leguminosarum]|uniref:hypothetical protein n=1 Tax=Rhizobium leguminosarum TaxID=384 RepID=UPI0021BC121F|nr:hypothetical protein [Rhizobium leguminosarum]
MSTGLASAAEPIVGNWMTTLGDTAAIEPCDGGFCITLKSGKHTGEWRHRRARPPGGGGRRLASGCARGYSRDRWRSARRKSTPSR